MMKERLMCVLMVVALGGGVAVGAPTWTNGSGDGQWETDANWDTGVGPVAGDYPLSDGSPDACTYSSATQLQLANLQWGRLHVDAELNVTGSLSVNGYSYLAAHGSAGVFNVYGDGVFNSLRIFPGYANGYEGDTDGSFEMNISGNGYVAAWHYLQLAEAASAPVPITFNISENGSLLAGSGAGIFANAQLSVTLADNGSVTLPAANAPLWEPYIVGANGETVQQAVGQVPNYPTHVTFFVPEPTTVAVLAMGLIGWIRRR